MENNKNNNSINNNKYLPIIIIKKIINYLIYKDYNYIKKLFFLSKNLQSFIINQINFFSFNNLKSLKSFYNDNSKAKQLVEEIEKIEIKDQLIKSFNIENFLEFKNLKEIKLTYTIGFAHLEAPNEIECQSIKQISNYLLKSNKFRISYTSNDYYYFKNHFNSNVYFNVLKKIKLKTFSINIDTLSSILNNSMNLESLDIVLDVQPYSDFNSFGDDPFFNDFSHKQKLKILPSFLFLCSSTSSSHSYNNNNNNSNNNNNQLIDDNNSDEIIKTPLKSLSIEIEKTQFEPHHDFNEYFGLKVLPNILKSQLQNISKIYFKGTKITILSSRYFFSSLSIDNITKLKLVNCFQCDHHHSNISFNNLIKYLKENQNLKRLSISYNHFFDYENKLADILKTHKSLSKIDISYTGIQLNPILASILLNISKFIKLTFSGKSDPSIFFKDSIETFELLIKILTTPIENFSTLDIKYRYSPGLSISISKQYLQKLSSQ
ncbi:hypothetical protein ACTA71_001057 [Dictyostelium dimigraforme]